MVRATSPVASAKDRDTLGAGTVRVDTYVVGCNNASLSKQQCIGLHYNRYRLASAARIFVSMLHVCIEMMMNVKSKRNRMACHFATVKCSIAITVGSTSWLIDTQGECEQPRADNRGWDTYAVKML